MRVAPEEEKLLRAFAEKFPDLKRQVDRALDYRICVEKEFCRLAGDVGALPGVPDSHGAAVECTERDVLMKMPPVQRLG
jgi:hypothetical protein